MLYDNFMRLRMRSMPKYKTASGYPCTFSNTNSHIENYRIYGDSTQETRSGKNLLPYPYSETTKTENGVTFTDNGDGTITVSGTATDDVKFYCCSETDRITISSGTYTMSGCPNGGSATTYYIGGFSYNEFSSGQTFTVTDTASDWFYIMIKSGATVNNLIFKPQLEVGSTATAYEQYGVMPSPEFPSEIQSVGDLTTKNLINESAITLSSGYWSDSGGNQINNDSGFIRISSVKCNPNETYTLSSNLKIYTIWFFNNNTSISKTYRENTVAVFKTPENCNSLRISLVNTSGNTDTIAFKWIQLEKGSTTTEYEPYHKYKIPIKVSGKNLLSKWYSNTYYSSCTKSKAIYMEPGTYNYHFERVDDTVTKWRYAMSIFDVDGGENDRLTSVYSYLATFTTNGWYCNDYGIVQTSADVTYSGAANVVFTILKPCYILWMLQLKNSSGTILDAKKYAKNVMLEKGEQYTGYEDYAEPMSKNIYLDEPLRKVGDYADYIDYKNQKVFRQIEVLDDTGTKTIDESLGTLSAPKEESIYLLPLSTVINGTNIITTGTTVEPSNIKIKYKE